MDSILVTIPATCREKAPLVPNLENRWPSVRARAGTSVFIKKPVEVRDRELVYSADRSSGTIACCSDA